MQIWPVASPQSVALEQDHVSGQSRRSPGGYLIKLDNAEEGMEDEGKHEACHQI